MDRRTDESRVDLWKAVITVTATPPEPGDRPQQNTGMPPEYPPPSSFPPPAYSLSDPHAPRRHRNPYSSARIFGGLFWAVLTILAAAGTIGAFTDAAITPGVLGAAAAVGCGWYDYRIWTFKAKRLFVYL
jgi:hypothetical protein